jgi:hypothetical protein
MADDARGNRQGGGKRRRYFRRKGGDKAQTDAPRAEQSDRPERTERTERPPRPERSDRSGRASRIQAGHEGSMVERHGTHVPQGAAHPGSSGGRAGVRRRRRNKNHRGDARTDQPVIPAAREPDYVPPQSVFVYTHIVRPGTQGYEFRSEHFSTVGRTLDDYEIDLSSLFDAEGRIQLSRIERSAFANMDLDDDEPKATTPAAAPLPPALEQADVGEADDSHFDDSRALPTRDIDGVPDQPDPYGAEDTPPSDDDPSATGPTVAVPE